MKQHQGADAPHVNKENKPDNQPDETQQSQGYESPIQGSSMKKEGPTDKLNIKEANLLQTIDKLQQELTVAHDKYLRLYAEFDNFKKRTAQEKLALIETASERVLQQILPIIDDFERALEALRNKDVSLEAVKEGVELIHEEMVHVLEQTGVEVIKVEKGSPFNPALHEAIAKTPVTDAALKGKVVDVVEKGYLLKNKVLRYAKVIVGE